MPLCPEHSWVELDPTKKGWYCEKCDRAVISYAEIAPGVRLGEGGPNDLLDLTSTWPSVLAVPLQAYVESTHPVLRLWAACDTVELLVRFLVIVSVAEFESDGGKLPASLAAELGGLIERPTLGQWYAAARALARTPAPDPLLRELRPYVLETLPPFLIGDPPATAESSFIALRNRLAHGAGLTRTAAAALVLVWQPRFEAVLAASSWLSHMTLATHPGRGEVTLRVGDRAVSLWPLTRFCEPRAPGDTVGTGIPPVHQIYSRRGDVRLEFTPIGSDFPGIAEGNEDEFEAFQALFRYALPQREIRGFEEDLRLDAAELEGRVHEVARIVALLRETPDGVIWLGGTAGVGKSCLLARVAVELLAAPPEGTIVLPFRFRTGDHRCSRDAFLRFAIERLATQSNQVRTNRDDPLRRLTAMLADLPRGQRVVFILDGLDEIAEHDPRFALDVALGLRGPGVLWLCAGRPERNLPEAFRSAGAVEPYPDGLPILREEDVRAILLNQLGPLRKRLLAGDREEADCVANAFVERVWRNAEGLPIYVRLVINDVKGARVVPEPGARLPRKLAEYHEEILRRCAVGGLQAVLTPLVAILALAHEPLGVPTLHALLVRRGVVTLSDRGRSVVRQALASVETMVKRAKGSDGGEGFTLYHHSLRQHALESSTMVEPVATARAALGAAGLAPAGDAAEPYLYRCGVRHSLDAGRVEDAAAVLCSFEYLMSRTMASPPTSVDGLLIDYQAVLRALPEDEGRSKLQQWEAFFREQAHLLRRGTAHWPTHKILLQVAVEDTSESPVPVAAERWLRAGPCDWIWLRRPAGSAQASTRRSLAVLEGHKGAVSGAIPLPDGRVLSWSDDRTLRVWDRHTGACVAQIEGHDRTVGALSLANGSILSWSEDRRLRISDGATGATSSVLEGHQGFVVGACPLPDQRILSWSGDGTVRVWSQDGRGLHVLRGHETLVQGAVAIGGGRILSWSWDRTLRVWDFESETCIWELRGHAGWVRGAAVLADDRILSWSDDRTMGLWDAHSGKRLARFVRGFDVRGACVLGDGSVLAWSDQALGLLEPGTGWTRLHIIHRFQDEEVLGAASLPEGRFLAETWSRATGQRLYLHSGPRGSIIRLVGTHDSRQRRPPSPRHQWLEAANPRVGGLSGGRFLWCCGSELRIYDAAGEMVDTLKGHRASVLGAQELERDLVLTWSKDHNLRLWECRGAAPPSGEWEDVSAVRSTFVLPGRRLACIQGTKIEIWSLESGESIMLLEGDARPWGARLMPDGRLISWGDDGAVRIWDLDTGTCAHVLRGHGSPVAHIAFSPDGTVLSWEQGDHRMWTSNSGVRHWDPRTGALLGFWPHGKLGRLPESLRDVQGREQQTRDESPRRQIEVFAREPSTGRRLRGAVSSGDLMIEIAGVCYHVEGRWTVDQVTAEGEVVVVQGHRVSILQLYMGGQRVTWAECGLER